MANYPIEYRRKAAKGVLGLLFLFTALGIHLILGWKEAINQEQGSWTVALVVILCASLCVDALCLCHYVLDCAPTSRRVRDLVLNYSVACPFALAFFFQLPFWHSAEFGPNCSLQVYQVCLGSLGAVAFAVFLVCVALVFTARSYRCLKSCFTASISFCRSDCVRPLRELVVDEPKVGGELSSPQVIMVQEARQQQQQQQNHAPVVVVEQDIVVDLQPPKYERPDNFVGPHETYVVNQCGVCSQAFAEGELCIRCSSCSHFFHGSCLTQRLSLDTTTCPLCGTLLKQELT